MASSPTHTNLDLLIEAPESPIYKAADKITQTRIFRGLHSLCLASLPSKGDAGTGAQTGWIVQEATVTRSKGEQGQLVIIWEAGGGGGDDPGQPLPADTYQLAPVELNPAVETAPYFADLTSDEIIKVNEAINGSEKSRTEALNDLIAWGGPPTNRILPYYLWAKKTKGIETFYRSAFRYTWSFSTWAFPDFNRGGYIEVPGGPLAGYLPPNLSWLREADSLSEGNAPLRITRSWLGSDVGAWDTDIYAP